MLSGKNIIENVNVLNSLKLERHYVKMFDLKDVEIIELYFFSDAVWKEYGALIHIRFNPIQYVLFWGCSWMGGGKKGLPL